jgi:sugar phosphate isomerase/epimerase
VKLGLYSITYLGVWYRGPALTLEAVIDRAREYGYDGIEIDGKRPHGNPLDMPAARCREIRSRAADAGVPVYAVAANNDFSSPIPEHREAQLLYVRDLVRMTADLGAPVLRVFLAWPGVTLGANGATYDVARRVWRIAHHDAADGQAWDRCRDGLIEAARWASDAGVTLALQNHQPVLEDHRDMLRMIAEVDSPALKACFDAPLARMYGASPPEIREAAREVGSLQVLSHFGGEYERGPDGGVRGLAWNRDGSRTPEDYYAEFLRGMADIGYAGYLGYELCHPLPQVDGVTVGPDFADLNARLAAEYLRGLIHQIDREPQRDAVQAVDHAAR